MSSGWLRDHFSKVAGKAKPSGSAIRRVPSMVVDASVRSSMATQTSYWTARSRSSTDLPATENALAASCTSPHEWSFPNNKTVNVILFGDIGVGKSAVINLIAQREVAKVSIDAQPCTLQTNRHDISFDGIDFRIFDTVGLDATRISGADYAKALIKGFKLITELAATGGVHLLVFVMRKGRITATMQSNYLLFKEAVCRTKVPTVLVITHLEGEIQMEDWWIRNKSGIESYGIKSDGHACVTTVFDDTSSIDLKHAESQRIIRELLKNHCLKGNGFLPKVHSGITRLGKRLQLFMEGGWDTKRADVMKVLTEHCKLDQDTARRLADRMELQDLGEDGEDQDSGNEADTLMDDIRSQFPHDLTGRVQRSDGFAFASGSCGDIYRGTFNLRGKSIQVAIKTCRVYLQHDKHLDNGKKRFRREIAVWVTLEHPNVLPLLGIIRDPNLNPEIPAMVCPWVENGALTSYLEGNRQLTISKRLSLVNDVAHGLQYLHSKQIVHGDLSGSNVLVHADGSACIADFGLSTLLTRIGGSTFSLTRHNKGTFRWMAPELFDLQATQAMPSIQSDVYSFGSIMLQILTGNIPYYYFTEPQVTHAVAKKVKPNRPDQVVTTANRWKFIKQCWSSVTSRPSSDQIVTFTKKELMKSKTAEV